MGFFTDLFEKLENCEVELFVKRNGNKLNVKVLPTYKDLDKEAKIAPMSITGSPVDIDSNFEAYIGHALSEANKLQVNTSDFKESVQKANKKLSTDTKTKSKDKGKEPKKQEAKPEEKKEEKASENVNEETGEIKSPESSGSKSLEDLKKESDKTPKQEPAKSEPVKSGQESINQENIQENIPEQQENNQNQQVVNDNSEW